MEKFLTRNGEDSMEKFYKKMISNERLVAILKCFNWKKWNKLSVDKKINLFKEMNDIINTFYPKLGESKFGFASSSNNELGNTIDDKFVINVDALLELDNHMEILATYLHELRHFYQNGAIELYNKTGEVHELFSEEDLLKIRENCAISAMANAQNYIINMLSLEIESSIQPTEYDAEMFAKSIMVNLSENFYEDNIDKINCSNANYNFDEVLKIVKKNENDIFNFKKMYYLNYEDYVSENKSVFETDQMFFDKYFKLVENIDSLNIDNICILFYDCFWIKCSDDQKISIIKKYVNLMGYEDCIEISKNYKNIIINEKSAENGDSFDVLEVLLDEMSDKDIEKILNKQLNGRLRESEKAIKLNFASDENVILKEKNPLFYNVQPYMLYKNGFMMKHINRIINYIDEVCNEKYNNFSQLDYFYKKYDVNTKIKKVESLTGKSFKQVYNEMLLNMTKTVRR